MNAKTPSKLPSPMDFPDVIQPVTAKDFSALWSAFGVDSTKRNSAEIRYERLSAQIAVLTGHEHAVDANGHPFSRDEWKANLFKSLNLLNTELKLGMDRQMLDVLTLCYTALQESPRYGGDPVIEAKKGENTAVHSIHTMLQALRVYQKTLENQPELRDNLDFFKSFQMTCLTMAVHDLGEMFGEAGSLAQVASSGKWDSKDKTETERIVFTYGVRLAIQTVIDKKGTEKDFFDKIDRIRAGTNMQNQGVHKSDAEMAAEVGYLLKDEISLSSRGRKLFGFLHDRWECIEDPKNSHNPFLGYLSAICERVQGTRHINRMLQTSKSPHHIREDNSFEEITTHRLMDSNRVLTNADYSEGHTGWMCHFIDPESPFERSLAKQALAWVYETMIDFFRPGPEAFFTNPSFKELPLHKDGSAFTPAEVRLRLQQIAAAKKVAGIEARELIEKAFKLKDVFDNQALPIGRNAIKRDDIVKIYERAIETGYFPKIVNVNGKTRGEILVRDLPVDLTQTSPTIEYSKKVVKEIEAVKAQLE